MITTDGCLSIDGRHIILTSKDLDQIQTFIKILRLKNKIGLKYSSYNREKIYYQVQFGNVKFYRFLLSIGLTPRKTNSLFKKKVLENTVGFGYNTKTSRGAGTVDRHA